MSERSRSLTDSQHEWLAVRSYLLEHRYDLAVSAADDYPVEHRIAGTPLLAHPRWLPDQPLDLGAVELVMSPKDEVSASDRYPFDVSELVLPVRPDGTRYPNYSAVVADLAPPTTFVNRPTYRLLQADLTESVPRMAFGHGRYFDGLDTGEACAHEYAASILRGTPRPLRDAVGAPWDLSRRPANLAISTLTLRVDRTSGVVSFLLHRRDATKVGHAGGLYQVLPVGIFQPAGDARWNQRNDFDLWRTITREYAEELLGRGEDYDAERKPIDYAAWPLARRLGEVQRDGSVRARLLGLGVDPLTFATDLLAVVAFDAALFDELFADLVQSNSEGQVMSSAADGLTFTHENVSRFARHEPMQAAGAAVLELGWQHRSDFT